MEPLSFPSDTAGPLSPGPAGTLPSPWRRSNDRGSSPVTIVPQPPLERSVLERKERDELATIAAAMGVKPSARASKSTLIDQILREAGIETAEEKPRRARVSKAAAAAAAAAAANGAEQASLPVDVTEPEKETPAPA